jgi:excisionase family DNA binding protein
MSNSLLRASIATVALTILVFRAAAQLSRESSSTVIVNEAAQLRLPPKPAGLTAVPLAKIDVVAAGANGADLQPAMNSYLVELFSRAERPRITEGERFNFLIRATLLTPPEMSIISKKGGKWNPFKQDFFKGLIGGGKGIGGIPEISLDNTNVVASLRCSVEMRLLDQTKEVIGVRKIDLLRTNNLRALSIELQGFRAGGKSAEDVDSYLKNLTGGGMREAIANLAAYHATTNLLAIADQKFMEPGAANPLKSPEPTPVVTPQVISDTPPPPVAVGDKSEWLTPKEAADVLKVTEADLLSAVEKGEIKARKIGSVIRIRREDLK